MLAKLASGPDWKIALALTAALRVFYSAMAAAFLPFLHPDPALIHSNALTENLPAPHGLYYALLGIWERFDTLWYLRIANHGYDLPAASGFLSSVSAAYSAVERAGRTDRWRLSSSRRWRRSFTSGDCRVWHAVNFQLPRRCER